MMLMVCCPPFPVVPRPTWHGSGTVAAEGQTSHYLALAAQHLSAPGFGITLPVWQINTGGPGQSGVGAVTRGCRLSALVGFGRPRDGPRT